MALEMKVYQDPHRHDPKVFAGLTSRQLKAVPLMVVLAGGTFVGVTVALMALYGPPFEPALLGSSEAFSIYGPVFDWSSDIGFYASLPVAIPIAGWGWWRPKGLRPETYLRYVIAHHLNGKVIPYVDRQQHQHTLRDAAEHGRSTRQRRAAGRAIVAREHISVRAAQRGLGPGRRP